METRRVVDNKRKMSLKTINIIISIIICGSIMSLQSDKLLFLLMAVCGGGCSAVFWWFLVVKPMRRVRLEQAAIDALPSR